MDQPGQEGLPPFQGYAAPEGDLPGVPQLPMQPGMSLQDVMMPAGGPVVAMSAVMPMAFNGDGPVNGGGPAAPAPEAMSADEIALYDRQIRLWGMQAQERIRSANVLLITMKALANEIAKNLVLAGVGSLTVADHEVVTEADLGAQFFLSAEDGHVGMNRAEAAVPQIQRLNPRVRVAAEPGDIRARGSSYFAGFDVVVATDLDPDALDVINTATRVNGRRFYAAGTHGLYGFIFADLIEHDYVIQRDRGNVATALGPESRTRVVVDVRTKKEGGRTVETVTKRELYSTWLLASDGASLPGEYRRSRRRLRAVSPALPCLRGLWEFQQARGRLPQKTMEDLKEFTKRAQLKHNALGLPAETLTSSFLRSFSQNIGAEVAPVAAILGGQLAQDVINVLGRTQQPIQNMVIFDGNTMEASVYPLHPEGALGTQLLPLAMAGLGGGGLGLGGLDPATAAMMAAAAAAAAPPPQMDPSGGGLTLSGST